MIPADHPTLIVVGDPSMWLPGRVDDYHTPAECSIIRIDGDLPTVMDSPEWYDGAFPRPLRVGDKVTLATRGYHIRDGRPGPQNVIGWQSDTPFATATVAHIATRSTHGNHEFALVTVADVEAL